ncbi:LppX_LprAFG lipoprotein [Haloechinothrix sp. LS1_15]|uniref:LppX_LprAFG lipoprotein n=1 Tax=Haloechinothrix sp. LS1_15 TaxID=2652248 RepID=UPI002944D96D|nr:LppX_LprAFG lipoprotein [Haloechinothrix sp. LS1_15]MDV6014741.1 LppX_LprAFG lipoprotein [Haloechinothrix sp. LS1_15]
MPPRSRSSATHMSPPASPRAPRTATARLVPALAALTAVAAAAAIPAGCATPAGVSEPLPAERDLTATAVTSLGELDSASVTFRTTGYVPGLAVHEFDGEVSTSGEYGTAQGEARLYHPDGERDDVEFMLANGTIHVTRGDGVRRSQPAPRNARPGWLFDADTGFGYLLEHAEDLRAESVEDLAGNRTYRVAATVPEEAVTTLLPEVTGQATVKFWVSALDETGQEEPQAVHRLWIQLPPQRQGSGAVLLELDLADITLR